MSPLEVERGVKTSSEWGSIRSCESLWVLPDANSRNVLAWQWASKPEGQSWLLVPVSMAHSGAIEEGVKLALYQGRKAWREAKAKALEGAS